MDTGLRAEARSLDRRSRLLVRSTSLPITAVAVFSLLVGSVVTVGADTAPPILQVVAPVQYQSYPKGAVLFSGTASDDVGVGMVRLAITDLDTGVTTPTYNATLRVVGQPQTSWSFTWQPPAPRSYSVAIQAFDLSSNASRAQTRVFDVAGTSGKAFLTLAFSRSQLGLADANCRPLPNAVPLDQVLSTLKSMNLPATTSVVTSYTAESTETCIPHGIVNDLYASWQQLASLRDNLGTTLTSAGIKYIDNRTLTPAQQEANICGSLPILSAHGHTRAWSLFSYPNNRFTSTIQTNITSRCFAYGRVYGDSRNHQNNLVAPPWYERTFSILGGACNNPSLPCYKIPVIGPVTGKNTYYASVDDLTTLMSVGAGEASVVQTYKFVTGSYNVGATTGLRWDCTASDWHAHYVTDTESYCWMDYLTAISKIPAGVTVTDPATVAQAMMPDSRPPNVYLTSEPPSLTNSTSATFGFGDDDKRSWFACTLDTGGPQVCDSGVTFTGLANGPHTFSLVGTDAFGNVSSPLTWNWTVNTFAPAATLTSTNPSG